MKVIILSIGLISIINASQRLLQSASAPNKDIDPTKAYSCKKDPYGPEKCVCKNQNKFKYKTCACEAAEKCSTGGSGSKMCNKKNCVKGCFCRNDNHILDKHGNCISKNECTTTTTTTTTTYRPTPAPTTVTTTGGTSFVHSSPVINLYKR